MKKVISFSLWGNDEKYTIGALKNADLALKIYPDWVCRYYIGKSTDNSIINALKKKKNVEVIEMDESGDWDGMFWRFYTIDDPEVTVSLSRDTDSRLSIREKLAVDQWMESDKGFHIMRDHPYHNIEILGGMWGIKKNIINDFRLLCDDFRKGNYYQVDQHFLREIIYPIVKDNCMVHDEFFNINKNSLNFPSKRENKGFVGEVYDELDRRNPSHYNLIP